MIHRHGRTINVSDMGGPHQLFHVGFGQTGPDAFTPFTHDKLVPQRGGQEGLPQALRAIKIFHQAHIQTTRNGYGDIQGTIFARAGDVIGQNDTYNVINPAPSKKRKKRKLKMCEYVLSISWSTQYKFVNIPQSRSLLESDCTYLPWNIPHPPVFDREPRLVAAPSTPLDEHLSNAPREKYSIPVPVNP